MKLIRLSTTLAIRDLWREPTAFLCQVLSLAAVLAPLLVLYGLKTGIVTLVVGELARNPAVREIAVQGVGAWPAELLADLRGSPAVGFVVPQPHLLNADRMWFSAAGTMAPALHQAWFMSTGPDDPLLDELPAPAEGQTVLSTRLARTLDVGTGDRVRILIERDGGRESATFDVEVAAILPAGRVGRSMALLRPETVMAVDRWMEGYREPRFGPNGLEPPAGAPTYPTFRIYAASLDDVAPLAEDLSQRGLSVVTNADQIAQARLLDRTLGIVFGIIAAVAAGGYLVSLGANLWANVSRKRHALSLLRLQGMARGATTAFPAVQGLVIAATGFAVAVALYGAAAMAINRRLGFGIAVLDNDRLCRLEPIHFAVAGAASLLIALLAAAVAARRVTIIDPAEGMRHA